MGKYTGVYLVLCSSQENPKSTNPNVHGWMYTAVHFFIWLYNSQVFTSLLLSSCKAMYQSSTCVLLLDMLYNSSNVHMHVFHLHDRALLSRRVIGKSVVDHMMLMWFSEWCSTEVYNGKYTGMYPDRVSHCLIILTLIYSWFSFFGFCYAFFNMWYKMKQPSTNYPQKYSL